MRGASYLEMQTIVAALEFALSRGEFDAKARQKRAAQQLIKRLRSNRTISGRQEQIMALLKNGASIPQMVQASGTSRRTIFRYLNHYEEAGFDLEIANGKYQIR